MDITHDKLLQPACITQCLGSLAVTILNDFSLEEKTLYVYRWHKNNGLLRTNVLYFQHTTRAVYANMYGVHSDSDVQWNLL